MFLVLILFFSFNFGNCFCDMASFIDVEVEIQEPEIKEESSQFVITMRRFGTNIYFFLESFVDKSCENINKLKAYLLLMLLNEKGSKINART